jgi:nucleotide-binding universal stress UspA family protein
MLRDLLVHVDGSEAGRRRTRFAADLASRTGARLSGLHVTPPPTPPPRYKPSALAKVAQGIAARLAEDARAAAAIFLEETAGRAIETAWREGAGDIVPGIVASARYADLVILGQYEWQEPPEYHPLPVAHLVALRCGRPVLVAPHETQACVLGKVGLAWDGSREAVRAIHEALPLLRLSSSVQILTVVGPGAFEDADDLACVAAHLTRHGVKVFSDPQVIRTPDENRVLRQKIEEGQYDLLVMGAYRHPAWMQFFMGGATRSILLTSKIPMLVSH